MSQLGRNTPCPCGSGKKFKHCCGRLAGIGPTSDSVGRFALEHARQEARERQRRLVQGLGRPIVSFEDHGYRIVAVGMQVRWSKTWRTFHDFLFDYIKYVLGPDWGTAELAKQENERHPILIWYHKVWAFQRAQSADPNGLFQATATGAVRAYIGLAYDLYLCAHNAELPRLLLTRLRNRQTFEGALYEAYVIGCLAKAGFDIELEDESDSTRSHCELTATHRETGRKFSVEAKAVTSTSTHAGATLAPVRVRGKLYDALCKQADYERIVFIELNRAELDLEKDMPDWIGQIDNEISQAEQELTVRGQPAPPAYVFITNRGFIHAQDGTRWAEVFLACGYKINDFASRSGTFSMLELARAHERHTEVHWLRKALQTYNAIPISFEDRLPEEEFIDRDAPRLLIGLSYRVPMANGTESTGVLTDGVVIEAESSAYGTYRLANGVHIVCRSPLTERELALYRRSPSTFFGVIKNVSHRIREPLDCFDFYWQTYAECSRERLLEFTAAWPDHSSLQGLGQKDLAQQFCARMAEVMWINHLSHASSLTEGPK